MIQLLNVLDYIVEKILFILSNIIEISKQRMSINNILTSLKRIKKENVYEN